MEDPVYDEVDAQSQECDGRRRQQRRKVAECDENRVLTHHAAPIGGRQLNTETEKTEPSNYEERVGKSDTELRDQRRRHIWQNLAPDEPPQVLAAELCNFYLVHDFDVRSDRASDPVYTRRFEEGDDGDEHRNGSTEK